ncbi:MAG: OmpA family protein [Verrucomicrobiota bacterium]
MNKNTMKKMIISNKVVIALATAFLSVSCSNTKRLPPDEGIYDSNAGVNTGGAYEDLSTIPVPALPDRDPSLNPEDADYQTLAAYTVYFGFDSFSIAASERTKLEEVANYLKANGDVKVILAGHTDSRGTVQYNLGLGERRSLAARDYLIGLGIASSRLNTISYGEERPADSAESEAAWERNRRAEIGVIR